MSKSTLINVLFSMNVDAVKSAGVQAAGQLAIDLVAENAKGVPGIEHIKESAIAQILAGNALAEVETKFGITDAGILGGVITATGFRNLMAKAPKELATYIGRVKGGSSDLVLDPDEAATALTERAAEHKRGKELEAAFNSAPKSGFNAIDAKATTTGQPTVTKPGKPATAAHNSAEAAPGNTVETPAPAEYLPKSKNDLRESENGKVICPVCSKGFKRKDIDKSYNNDKPDAKWKGVFMCGACRNALDKQAKEIVAAEKAEKERTEAEARCNEISDLLLVKYEALATAEDKAKKAAELDDEDILAAAEAKVSKLDAEIKALIDEQNKLAAKHGFIIETEDAEPSSDDAPTPDKARVVTPGARVDNAK